MVFYDLTNLYRGQGTPEIGANGHSHDGEPRNPQMLGVAGDGDEHQFAAIGAMP